MIWRVPVPSPSKNGFSTVLLLGAGPGVLSVRAGCLVPVPGPGAE